MWSDGLFGQRTDAVFFGLTLAVAAFALWRCLKVVLARRMGRFIGASTGLVVLAMVALIPCWWMGTWIGVWIGVLLAGPVVQLGVPFRIAGPVASVCAGMLLAPLLTVAVARFLAWPLTASAGEAA